jgi:pimeloyl-ACP methyl ester carboxylesterase
MTTRSKPSGLPLDGRWHCTPKREFEEVVVFVHHYGGNRSSVKKHADFVSALGFDSVCFTLGAPYRPGWIKRTPLGDIRYGLRQRWETEIGRILDAIPRPKIIYSFSFPSIPAACALAEREAQDVRAWICDGGPFLMPVQCFWNYYTHHERTPALWLRTARVAAGVAALGMWNLKEDLYQALEKLPANFPVLSVRYWQDQLVPIAAIDEAFSGNHRLKLETLTLPEGDHIEGLQNHPAEYKPRVAQFLKKIAHPLSTAEANY